MVEDNPNTPQNPPTGEVLLYVTEDGRTRVECRFEDETIWLSQALMAELFETTPQNITQHINGLVEDGEIDEVATCKDFLQVRTEGERTIRRRIRHYNLEVIVAVGFRVRSKRGTQFRQWANGRLQEYLVKGFAMDDARLKSPPADGSGIPDYFEELLERIRDIRASEARVYLRVREIFALAADYEPNAKETAQFFQIIQNKLHYASTGQTAAEIITSRVNHALPNMGLTTWKNAPEGQIIKSDVKTAKNYLSDIEIDELNRIVVMWLDFADDQARRRKQVFMNDWQKKLDEFLAFNDRDVLQNAGQMSHVQAVKKAEAEYDAFATNRRKLREQEGTDATLKALAAEAEQAKSKK